MEYQGAFRGQQLHKPWDFTVGWEKRVGIGRVEKEKRRTYQVLEVWLCRWKINNLKCLTTKIRQRCHCLAAWCYYNVRRQSNSLIKKTKIHTSSGGRFCVYTVPSRRLFHRAHSWVPQCLHHHLSHFYLLQLLRRAAPLGTVIQKHINHLHPEIKLSWSKLTCWCSRFNEVYIWACVLIFFKYGPNKKQL